MTIHGPGEFDEPLCFNLKAKVAAASLIVAISNYGKSQLMKISDPAYWKKLEVVYLGIEGVVFTPQPLRSAPQPFEVICVGRLAPVKGHEVLIEAVELLIRRGADIRLRLVGDGTERPALERKVRALGLTEQVLFEGWKNQTEVIELYKNSDAFALASFAEGVPVVLMEAMSMQIPCIATRITGIPELITDGVDGLLVSPGSSDELAEALMRLMNDLPLRERLAKSGRETVAKKYDLRRNAEQLADVFRKRFLEIEGRHESTRARMMHSEDPHGAGEGR
jgi:colanic acid/amylovoran biosynthesis glycosyltransferase